MSKSELINRSVEHRAMLTKVNTALKPYDLTLSEWMVLSIVHNQKSSISDVANILESSLAFASNMVRNLIKKGLVVKTASDRDLRSVVVGFIGSEKLFKKIEKIVDGAIA